MSRVCEEICPHTRGDGPPIRPLYCHAYPVCGFFEDKYSVPDSRCQVPDTGYLEPDTRYLIRSDTEGWIPSTESGHWKTRTPGWHGYAYRYPGPVSGLWHRTGTGYPTLIRKTRTWGMHGPKSEGLSEGSKSRGAVLWVDERRIPKVDDSARKAAFRLPGLRPPRQLPHRLENFENEFRVNRIQTTPPPDPRGCLSGPARNPGGGE
jgi:hypothetical protein